MRGYPNEQIFTQPPFLCVQVLCVEVLSPDDSMSSMQERIDDYLAFGVENIWIVDPRRRKAFSADRNGLHESASGILETRGAPVRVDLNSLWPE